MAPKAIFYVEGNIGAGKSSLLAALAAQPNYVTVTEPVEVWQKTGMLELFYQKQIDASSFQSMVSTTHFAKLFRAIGDAKDEVVICERSLLIGAQAFADVCIGNYASRAAHCISVKELASLLPQIPTFYIYLDTPADKCMDRLRERNRDSERDLTVDYLKRIEASHCAFMLLHEKEIPIMVLDGSKEKEAVARDCVTFIDLKTR